MRFRSYLIVACIPFIFARCGGTDPVFVTQGGMDEWRSRDPNLERLLRSEDDETHPYSGTVRRYRVLCTQGDLSLRPISRPITLFNHRNPEYGSVLHVDRGREYAFFQEEAIRSAQFKVLSFAQGFAQSGKTKIYAVERTLRGFLAETPSENVHLLGEVHFRSSLVELAKKESRAFYPWGRSEDGEWVIVPTETPSPTGQMISHYSIRTSDALETSIGSIYLRPNVYYNLRLNRTTGLFSADLVDNNKSMKVIARFDFAQNTLQPGTLRILSNRSLEDSYSDVALEELPDHSLLLTQYSSEEKMLRFFQFDANGENKTEWLLELETDSLQSPFPGSAVLTQNEGTPSVVIADQNALRILTLNQNEEGHQVLRTQWRQTWSHRAFLSALKSVPSENSFVVLGSSNFRSWGVRWDSEKQRLVPIGLSILAPCFAPSFAPEHYTLRGDF